MAICCICEKEKDAHLTVAGKNICAECERKILTCAVQEDGYRQCAGQLKKLFETVQ